MITIRVQGLKELKAGFDRAARGTEPILREAIRKSGVLVKQNVRREAPVFESTLKKSIEDKPQGLKTTVFVGASAVKYGYVQEYGRTSKKMPPPKALEKWAAVKLGDKSLAFVLARSIAKKGTKPHPFMQPGFETSLPGIEKLIDRAGSKIIEII